MIASKLYRATLYALVAILISLPLAALGQDPKSDEPKDDKKDKKAEELPLKTDKKISFTTDEGTWMSLDVSSDGRTIVFDLLGDIYTMPIGGGSATRITSGSGFDGQPRFSPDGKSIVFVSDRSGSEYLYLINPDGQRLRPLT